MGGADERERARPLRGGEPGGAVLRGTRRRPPADLDPRWAVHRFVLCAGRRRSANPAGQLSYPRLAADIAALIKALGLHRPVVGGWSDGGQVTLELGARYPGAAAALIAGAAYPDFKAGGLREAHRA